MEYVGTVSLGKTVKGHVFFYIINGEYPRSKKVRKE